MMKKIVALAVLLGMGGFVYGQAQEIPAPPFGAKNAQDYYQQGKELIAQGKYRQANEAFKRAEALLDEASDKDSIRLEGEEKVVTAAEKNDPGAAAVTVPREQKKDKKEVIFSGSSPEEDADDKEDIMAKAEKLCAKGLRMDKLRAEKEEIRDYEGAAAAQKEMMRLYAKAINIYQEAAKKQPGNRNIRYNLGVVYANRAEYRQAVEEFEKVVALNRRDADAYYNLGIIYENFLDDYRKALRYYNLYLRYAPKGRDREAIKNWVDYIKNKNIK